MSKVPRGRAARGAIAAGVLALSMVLAACGGATQDATGDVASLDRGGSTKEQTGEKEQQPTAQARQDAVLAYARCMRENGVDMPDPQMDGDGMSMTVSAAGGENPDPDTLDRAQEACQEHQQQMMEGMPEPSAEDMAKARDNMVRYAGCMREHGVDMADPEFDADGLMKMPEDQVDYESPEVAAAAEECSEQLGGAGGAAVAIPGAR